MIIDAHNHVLAAAVYPGHERFMARSPHRRLARTTPAELVGHAGQCHHRSHPVDGQLDVAEQPGSVG